VHAAITALTITITLLLFHFKQTTVLLIEISAQPLDVLDVVDV
jgi:hypothetical protein